MSLSAKSYYPNFIKLDVTNPHVIVGRICTHDHVWDPLICLFYILFWSAFKPIITCFLLSYWGAPSFHPIVPKYFYFPQCAALAIHDVTSATNGQVTIQQGILQQVSCTTLRPGESVASVLWYRGNSDIDPRKERLIGQNDNRANQKYALTSYNGLIIKDVTKQDEGNYVCIVVLHEAINRYSVVEVHVIGETLF